MNAIPSRKRQFNKASRCLANDESYKLELEQQIASLQAEVRYCDEKIVQGKKNKVTKGLQYFSKRKRATLLNDAERLSLSKETIARLRSYDDDWNEDCIDCNIITDFEALEKAVNDNKPSWEKSFFNKLGKVMNQRE